MGIVSLSLEQIETGLQHVFPDVPDLSPLSLLGEGFGSLVVETPGGLVFRIGRVPETGEAYAREARLLPQLKPYLPVAIPDPHWYLPRTEVFPYGVFGYRKLPGVPMQPEDARGPLAEVLAEALGRLLSAMHSIPANLFPAPVSFDDRQAGWREVWVGSQYALRDTLTAVEYQAVVQWWERFLSDDRMKVYTPMVTHGDFWHENVLVADGHVVGLLDFQEAAVDDPARDFIPLLYLGEAWLRRVMAAYRRAGGWLDEGFEHRLWNLWALREFGGVVYSLHHNDQVEMADSIAKIRKGPILSPYGLDGWGSG